MSERLALAVFVKNEEHDIAWWLGWHIALGFSTIIVYDDNSTDKTRDIVQSASESYDIRLEKSQQHLRFNHRQKYTYEKSILDAKNEFDWLMFLDSDEYLDLGIDQNVSSFLKKFPNASAIAINWCCFGSSGYITRPPNSSPIESYIYRSQPNSTDANKIVKSIFRPDTASGIYINPHQFDINGIYVSSDGSPIIWDEVHPEKTKDYPTWINARVRHYACRSLADFIEKVERRSDIRDAPAPMNYFKDFDINEVVDYPEKEFLLKVRNIVANIRKNYELNIYSNIRRGNFWDSYFDSVEFNVFNIKTVHSTTVMLDSNSGDIIHSSDNNNDNYIPIYGLIIKNDPNIIYLTCGSKGKMLHLSYDDRFGSIIPFKLEKIEGDNYNIGLRNPHSGRSICWLQPDSDTRTGEAHCNRQWLHAWEKIQLKKMAFFPEEIKKMAYNLFKFSQIQSYSGKISIENIDEATSFLWSRSRRDQEIWEKEFDVTLPCWIKNSHDIVL
ncbi:glycosyltransferase family 2 protein [Neokomagataea thailandica]|uniref:Glycosyltransferase 2-like domain-containing protein n=1 Tax=Neokomagataea tanensis NBRC 106556 TaxID=1223519 RepID=A0ABQ0QLV1_9PROT|nr:MULTISPECIES: glycosyltransferase family 2 protein [Neokomagataea]GBR49673.1 hypothetical protein AA106556_2107 [Neokomagataea tanensis NBRC 106556]